jgi:predicted thioesterase
MRVTATAEVVALDGRTVTMRVVAHDEKERIGGGTHERVVVNVARFDARVQAKAR